MSEGLSSRGQWVKFQPKGTFVLSSLTKRALKKGRSTVYWKSTLNNITV